MDTNYDLAALIGSRICHDLISPIGAIGNGLELMIADGKAVSPELALICESVASANSRIQFFRAAYGVATADQRIARGEVSALLAGLSQGSRLRIDFQSDIDLDRRAVKLALLLLQCLESAMPWGRLIRITQSGETWEIVGEGERLRIEPGPWALLAGEAGEPPRLGPAQVQFALAAVELKRGGRRLALTSSATQLRLNW